jgi:4'-phosphopantetheinyl transferase
VVNDWLRALVDNHEVHLWHVSPGDVAVERLLAAYYDLLTPVERERMARFVFEKGRHEYLITRALVRTTLSTYHPDVDPRSWQFVATPYGRPEVQAPLVLPRLVFNLSHTDGQIVCLVAVEREVGVDIERTTRDGTVGEEIAERFFSPSEVAELRALPVAAQPSRFFDYWTLKEAYIKARGLGLQLPLDQFSFHLGASEVRPAQPIWISFGPQIPDDPATWQFDLRDLTPGHRLAIAIRRRPDEPDLALRILPVVPLSQPPRPSG